MSELTLTSIESVGRLLIMIAVGFIGTKVGVITKEINDHITTLLVKIILPIMMLSSYFTAYDKNKSIGLIKCGLVCLLLYIVSIAIVTIIIPKKGNADWGIDRASALIGNCGFLGIPLISVMLGQEGVLYMTGFLTVNNLFAWTYGQQCVVGDFNAKSLGKSLCNSCNVAIYIGLIIYFTQLKLPTVLTEVLTQVGNCNTPLAMIVAGSTIARSDIIKNLKDLRFYIVIIFKLVLEALICLPILKLCKADGVVALSCYIAAATPVAAIVNIFAVDADKNYGRASSLFAFTTVLFMISLPLMIALYEYF